MPSTLVERRRVRAELLEGAQVGALDQQVEVEFAQHRAEAVRVFDVVGVFAAVGQESQAVAERLLRPAIRPGEEALLADLRQIGDDATGRAVDHADLARLRQEGADHQLLRTAAPFPVHAEDGKGIVVIGVHDTVYFLVQRF